MTTIVLPPTKVRAAQERCFLSTAAHIIHPNQPRASAEESVALCNTPSQTKLAADDLCILVAPIIVAHSAPCPIVKHLNSALVACSSVSSEAHP